MCCSDTFTTVVSSTSMKVPSITEMAMIHGLIAGFSIIYVASLQTAVTAFLFAIGLLPCYLPLVVYGPRGLERAKICRFASDRCRSLSKRSIIRFVRPAVTDGLAKCQLPIANCYFVYTTGS